MDVKEQIMLGSRDDQSEDYVDFKEKSGMNVQERITLCSQFVVQYSDLNKYWDASQNSNPKMKERRFNTTRIGFDWPRLYGSPCVVIIKYNHALKFNSAKKVAFANINGV